MARIPKEQKTFVVSCRVSSEEMRNLKELATGRGISISDLLRKGLSLAQQKSVRKTKAREGKPKANLRPLVAMKK